MLSAEHDSREDPCATSLDFSFLVLLPRVACTYEDLVAKLFCNRHWLPVARDVLQSDPASVLFSCPADPCGFQNSFQVSCAKH
ncbi:unnamed protein product [Strongylus vulgaris]|uniref:Uncharacterized protein n=1 Tax=Strongylus vulgaris TaxID=40348 RepID=A0A3P7J3F1_STRVU|nr:unnamed protein product [Strongylus vulgaris]